MMVRLNKTKLEKYDVLRAYSAFCVDVSPSKGEQVYKIAQKGEKGILNTPQCDDCYAFEGSFRRNDEDKLRKQSTNKNAAPELPGDTSEEESLIPLLAFLQIC